MDEPSEPSPVERLWALPTDALVEVFDEAMAAVNRHTAVALRALRELEGRAVPDRDGATSTAVWVRNRQRVSISTAHRLVKASVALDAAPAALQDAVDSGEVNLDQAEVITRAVDALPRALGTDVRDLAAKELTRLAAEFEPRLLAHAGERVLQLVAPDAADEYERQALERAEARASRDRHVTLVPDRSGAGYRLTGRLTNEAAATFRAAIDPLCAPATADERTPGQRRADAFVDICRLALDTTELPRHGGDRPQIVVTVPYGVLERELGAGTLDNGDRVTPETARRIACDSRILPVVLNGTGQPLDVGRTRRLVNGSLRRALGIRDGGCAFPGCDRGLRWADAHHVVPWAAGGATALDNMVLLCARHHTELHKSDGWTVHIATDGFASFIPPPYVDPDRRPRRNRYHRRL